MKKGLLVLALLWTSHLFSQGYEVSHIGNELTQDADAVVRIDQGYFKILSMDKAEFTAKRAVTIFNERANDHAHIVLSYDKLSSLSEIMVTVYDANGKRIRKVKASEIYDRSAFSDNLFDDVRIKYIDAEESNYPYTVEYSYKKKYKFLYSIPNWTFSGDESTSVLNSTYTLEYPPQIGARYKEVNFKGDKNERTVEGNQIISWTMTNMPTQDRERYGPSYDELRSGLNVSVAKFSFEGYEGDLSSWDGMAAWQLKLNEGRNDLSPETLSEIRKLTEGMDREEKIRTVYSYLQENTRYVSIQLGVGGFQPFPASTVEQNGYGDCKALSFFTQTLLEAVGVEAYYTWVEAGYNPRKVDKSFPEDNFNHIILAVPNGKDTVWLECTNQANPFGYLGRFTGDREALLISNTGGHIVKTESYPLEKNNKVSSLDITVNENGSASISAQIKYQGIMADRTIDVASLTTDDQKKYLEENIDLSTFVIDDFKVEVKGQDAYRTMNLQVNKLFSKSGTRIFLQPNVMNKNYFVPLKYDDRKTDIVVRHSFNEYDTVQYEFPTGYRIEAAFEPIRIESEFGIYTSEIVANEDGKFQYIRHFMQLNGRYDASKYDEYLQFHKKVVRADKRKIALISGT